MILLVVKLYHFFSEGEELDSREALNSQFCSYSS